MADCRYHPETPGVGICVRCETVICAVCSTRLRGMNFCHACLDELAHPLESAPWRLRSTLRLALLSGLALAFLFGLFWLVQGQLAP